MHVFPIHFVCLIGNTCLARDFRRPKSRFTYYISPYERSRIRAVIQSNFDKYFVQDLGIQENVTKSAHFPPNRADFVWLHTITQHDRGLLANPDTHIVSQLSGINVFEDKANLALLLRRLQETQKSTTYQDAATDATQPTSSVQTLESHVINGREEFSNWCTARFGDCAKGGFWIAKESGGNGAEMIYPFGCDNWRAVLKVIRPKARFVNAVTLTGNTSMGQVHAHHLRMQTVHLLLQIRHPALRHPASALGRQIQISLSSLRCSHCQYAIQCLPPRFCSRCQ